VPKGCSTVWRQARLDRNPDKMRVRRKSLLNMVLHEKPEIIAGDKAIGAE
jgi:hypothetical protein